MDKSLKKIGEKYLKTFLKKRKIGYTAALLTVFLMTGTIKLDGSTKVIEKENQIKLSEEILFEDILTQKKSIQEFLDENEIRLRKLRNNNLILLKKRDFYSKPVYPSTQIFFNLGWEHAGKMKDRTTKEFFYDSDILRDRNGTVVDDKVFVETLNIGANVKPVLPNIPIISKNIFIKTHIPNVSLSL